MSLYRQSYDSDIWKQLNPIQIDWWFDRSGGRLWICICGSVPVDLYLWKLLASPGYKSSQKSKYVEYLQVLIFNKSWSKNERENNLHYALPFLIKEIFRMVSREKGTTSNNLWLPGPDSWQVNLYAIILNRKSVYLIFAYILFMHRLILSYTGWLLPTLCLILSDKWGKISITAIATEDCLQTNAQSLFRRNIHFL